MFCVWKQYAVTGFFLLPSLPPFPHFSRIFALFCYVLLLTTSIPHGSEISFSFFFYLLFFLMDTNCLSCLVFFLLLNLRSCSCCCVWGNLIKEKEKYIVFRYHIWLTQKTERANESVHFYTVKSLLHFQSLSLSGKENTEMVFYFSSVYINPPKRHQTCRLMQSNSKSALKE